MKKSSSPVPPGNPARALDAPEIRQGGVSAPRYPAYPPTLPSPDIAQGRRAPRSKNTRDPPIPSGWVGPRRGHFPFLKKINEKACHWLYPGSAPSTAPIFFFHSLGGWVVQTEKWKFPFLFFFFFLTTSLITFFPEVHPTKYCHSTRRRSVVPA